MTQVLLWDIDGTLLTTARAGVLALEDAAREVLGVNEPPIGSMVTAGLTDAQVAALAIETCGATAQSGTVAAFLAVYERELPSRLGARAGRVLPGVAAILDDLRARDGVASMLLTGNTRAGAYTKLTHYGLSEYFPQGAFCEGRGERTEIARRAARLASRQNPDAVLTVIGDTPHDVSCGEAVGARTVAVASGQHTREALQACAPWLVLDELPAPERFAELLGLT